jgi:hypothetical protein
MRMDEPAQIRANRGAALLDQEWPKWAKQIDIDKIDMSDTKLCVGGQLASAHSHDFYSFMAQLFGTGGGVTEYRQFGFWPYYDGDPIKGFKDIYDHDGEDLENAWIDLIEARRNNFA